MSICYNLRSHTLRVHSRSCGPGALFPCDWSGSVLTPQNPTDPKYAHQPDFGSVQQIAAMVARHWPAFFEKELGEPET